MAYQLRSRKDPASLDIQEQTDTPEGNLTEIQVTTPSQLMVVPPQLSETEHTALPVTEASLSQITPSASTKPETVSTSSLDFEGPTRFDPGLVSAAVSVGALPPADTVGPPSAVIAGRDASLIGNQTPQLYDTIDTSSLCLVHDSQEVKHTTPPGTTLVLLLLQPFYSSLDFDRNISLLRTGSQDQDCSSYHLIIQMQIQVAAVCVVL